METKLKLFNEKSVRTVWNADEEEWYFSVVDIVEVLTDSTDPKQYIKKLRARDKELASKWGTICTPVEMTGKDGKKRQVIAATTKGILRLVQSIPSPKAEPFKVWLAQVGAERLDEIADPEKAILRGAEFYRKKGYSPEWINQRMRSIEVRKQLTDEWNAAGVETDKEYAILTNELTKAWSGKTVKEYKELKGLKKESLRDNMTNLELIFNMLAEATTARISQNEQPQGFNQSRLVVKKGGAATREARERIEEVLGESIVSPLNATDKEKLVSDILPVLPTSEE